MRRRTVLALGLAFAGSAVSRAALATGPTLSTLPHGEWVKIHEQSAGDAVTFKRQLHGGAVFDSRRARLVLFGSDTHGEDWTNSPLFFDPAARHWSRLYPDDDPATYRVDRDGVPVAGANGDHPWAMHTFGALAYDAAKDALIVSSEPAHLRPGQFTDAMARVWPSIRRHPTWMLDLASGRWAPLAAPSVSFFPYATAYDPGRGVVIGYKSDGVFEFGGQPLSWRKVLGPGLLGYHDNATFDTRLGTLVVFGSNENSNDVIIYDPATRRHAKMPTPGLRPPKSQFRPMAYHAGIDRVIVLFDRGPAAEPSLPGPGAAETWLYDLGGDAWTQVESARLPFRLGMNYNLVYDSVHQVLLLVANLLDEPTSVWALRL